MSNALTTSDYWDTGYSTGASMEPLRPGDFRRHADLQVVESIAALGLEGKRVLEVGAGNSAMLTALATRLGGRARFTGLDYAPAGCRMLAERAEREGAIVEVLHQDLFAPSPSLDGQFDVVFSIGVVEHFTDLGGVLRAMRRFLAPGGRMFTLIPNMRGLPGVLVRRYNRAVYELHVPHDMASFVAGHRAAGLEVENSRFLCSTNFGVLSSCFRSPGDPGFTTYKWLSRVSKALWLFESRVGDLPALPALSPYLIAVSHPAERAG